MKLSVGDIKFSESGYASTHVEVEAGTYPCIPLSICTMHVSVPLVEGKALEQYKEELLAKARERIDIMYKEIVCGGSQVLNPFKIEITSSPRDKLEERVALLEKRQAEMRPEMTEARDDELIISSIYDVARKAAADFIASRKQELFQK
ncbi:hypothetical protein SFE26_004689 [Salmonella enterica]|nr:hypothetical protein [Salmonella enterica]EDS3650911.1 hypothetical protein [Salmonella enterica]ELD4966710.1 hypothetical protein [Salmonella enterica]ELI1687223.1 hypothetical protein [Salmonella enterica]ELT4346234.1 hypothetical protein [Salmonella enterica]